MRSLAKLVSLGTVFVLLTIQLATAEPLIIEAKLTPSKPSVGDTVGIYITIQGLDNESVQVITKLKDPVFKVVDIVNGENVEYTTLKNGVDFKILKGQTVQIIILGELTDANKLATIFPNAYSIESPFASNPTPTPTVKPMLNNDYSNLRKLLGNLKAKYQNLKVKIPERIQLIIEQKLRDAEDEMNKGLLKEAKNDLDEVKGLLEPYENNDPWENVVIAAIILTVIVVFIFALKYYLNLQKDTEEIQFRLMR